MRSSSVCWGLPDDPGALCQGSNGPPDAGGRRGALGAWPDHPRLSFFVLSSSPRGPQEVVSRLRENLARSQGQVKVPDSLGELGPPRGGHRINPVPAGEAAGSRAGKNAPSIH